jgi:gliding motility-associated-like protein
MEKRYSLNILNKIQSYNNYIWISIFIFLIPYFAFSTHVVGGSLTYVYNGGSNYTITLKLYRDCGPGTAALPGSVTIQILDVNGAAFNPSKNVTINLTSVANIAPVFDPCAIPPNPSPCVEEAIYTTTVNNLPPSPNGYHMYFQICCRNGSIINITNPGAAGETYYANIPGAIGSSIWNENFTLANTTTIDNGSTSWTSAVNGTAPSSFGVNGNIFQVAGANNAGTIWTSQTVNIASCLNANLSVDLSEAGTMDANDSIFVYYSINGGPLIPFPVNGIKADDFTSAVATANGISGNTVKIVIRTHFDGNSPNSEIYSFDNVNITCNSTNFLPNSDPVFNFFPPLFICVNKPFTFNHSATDINGDSLVYSLYQPYNNTAPTFSNNVAIFPPVTYVGGYNSSSPLGAGPFSINSSTGLLTGTPGTLGQFVVGVKVKEYRNGIYIGETIRDFQFNVVNCPQPPPTLAVPNATINNGCTAKPVATGISSVSATWTSISPGVQGAFNNYLACTSGCLSNTVSPVGTPPPFIDFLVCGIATSCAGNFICDTFRVFFNPTLNVSILPSNPTLCFGQTSTTITAVGAGGTPPYTYLWNNVNPSQTINVGAGTYNVQLSDASGCPPVYNTVAVTAFTAPITANAGADQTRCIQNPLATLNGTVTGASGGIWSSGTGTFSPNNTTLLNLSYTPSATELANGFVNLILTSTGNGTCPLKKDTVRITYVNFTGTPTPTINNISCFGGTNGSATMALTGGFPPFTYSWNTSPIQTTPTASNLPIGMYSVTIQDALGCSTQTTITISQPPILSINSNVTNVPCFGGSTGSIVVTPSGGTSPYTYSWSPGSQTTSSITSLPIGNYSVIVSDSKGCIKTNSFTITQPTSVTATFSQTNIACSGLNNGAVTTTVAGGTTPYTYSWSPGGSTSPNATGLSAGAYTLTITDNLNCTKVNTITITQPTSLTAVTSVTNESCNYLNNGSASITVSGGTIPYTYLWSPGSQTTTSVSNQTSGTYTVLATDNNGCTISNVITITEPAALTVSFLNQTNVSCFGGNNGSVVASPSGGTPNYTYSWSPGSTSTSSLTNIPIGTYTVSVTDSKSCVITNTITITEPTDVLVTNSITNITCNGLLNGSITQTVTGGISPYTYLWLPMGQTTSSISTVAAGNYSVSVTDGNGCIKTLTYNITQPAALTAALTATGVSCFGGNNAQINSNVLGGTFPYTYSWSPGGASTPSLSAIPASTVTLTVTDINNCITTSTIAVTQPSLLVIAATFTNETCDYLNNGIATTTVTGGTGPYTFSWSPISASTSSVSNLSAGIYTVTATDSKNCVATNTINITQPLPINITFTNQINVSCFGGSNGSIESNISGGTPNYSYTWTPGNTQMSSLINVAAGTYTINIKDNQNCIAQNTITITQPTLALGASVTSQSATCFGLANGTASITGLGGTPSYNYTWSPGNIIGSSATNLASGTYSINTIDSKGCSYNTTVNVTQPPAIMPVTSSTNSTCGNNNGIGSVSVTGGVFPYTYQWMPTGGTNTITPGIQAGSYTIMITDANGCQGTQFLNINDQGGPIASIFSITNVSCFGGSDGSVTASVVGGLAPITYSWSPYGGTSTTANGLTAGNYYITVTDANGCVALATTNPQVSEPPAITSIITTSNVSCFGGTNGTATVTASGGTPGYTYTWLPSSTNGTSISGLSATNYSVQIKDINNCVLTSTFSVAQPTAALSISPVSSSVSCFGGTNGTVDATVNGGTGPYSYNWLPGNFFTHNVSNLSAGTYSINTTDSKGCTQTNTIIVNQATKILLTTGSVNSNCTLANGQASVSATGGTGSYNYNWSPSGGTNSTATGLLLGTYTVIVNDGNNCIASSSISVTDNPKPTLTVSQTASVSCFGGSNGSLIANPLGGTGPYTYTWSPSGGNNQTAINLPSSTYTVKITAANGCTVIATSSIIPQPLQLFSIITKTNVSCFSGSNGKASVIGGGGTPSYSFLWLPSASTGSTVAGLSSGTYSVQITDANNCVLTSTYSITQPTIGLSATATSSAVSCFGGNNGIAQVSVTGGTALYNYNWLPLNINSTSVGGLSAGTYTVNVTDSKNCIASTTVLVSQPVLPLSASANGVATSCSGGSDGTATVTPVGGTAGYSYQWSPTGGNGQTSSGLSPGTYFINVTDSKNCTTNISINISAPTPVTGNLVVLNPACNLANGTITSQISGGTSPYTYSWSPGSVTTSTIGGLLPGTYTLQAFDSFNCANTLTTSLVNISGPVVSLLSTSNDSCFGGNDGIATININSGTSPYITNWLPYGGSSTTANQLSAGTYTANVTDVRGCLTSITAQINEPGQVLINLNNITNVSCFGGSNASITVSASGGTPGYTYSWSPSGNNATINNLGAGTYTVKVTDAHYCTAVISMGVTQPTAALTSSISSVNNLLCHNSSGSASATAAGGTMPYSYLWSTTPPQTGSTASNILSGTYTVNIADVNGCTSSNTVTLLQPSDVISNGGINDTICLGNSGTLIASASGGAGNYYYVWQPVNITNSGTLTVNPTANTNYTVVAFDQNGCAGIPDTVRTVVYVLSGANVQTFGQSPICAGQSSIISALVSGSTGPISYSWSNGLGTGPGPFITIPTTPTTYYVNILNSCGVTIIDSVVIDFNPPPTILASFAGTLVCVPGSVSFIDNSLSGNSNDPITSWLWDFGDGNTSTLQNPSHDYNNAGTYSITLSVQTDGGCVNNNGSSPVVLNAYPTPVAQFSLNTHVLNLPYDQLICTNQSIGAASYNWNFGDGSTTLLANPNHNYTTIGNYQIQLIAISPFGCSDTTYQEVITDADVVFPNAFTPNGNGPSGGYYIPGSLDNDIFFPYTSGVVEFKFQIFDRWGELIFETDDIKQGWDGYYREKICQLGVYIWKAYVKLNNGKEFNKTGDVTLLR